MIDEAAVETPEVEAPETAELETPETEAAEVPEAEAAEPVEPAEGEETEEQEEVEGQTAASPDGRKMPDSLKKALAAVKATSPEAAKELRGIYFANQEYRTIFPTVADATTAKTLIDEIGGPEGVQEIAAEREEWGSIDRQYSEGSPDFIKNIAESNPEAFVKIAPHAINEWATRAPEQYAYFAQSLTVNMLKNAGIPEKLESAYNAAETPQLKAAIADVYNKIVDMHEKAQNFAQRRPDPEREKFQQEKQAFEQQRRASFEDGVAKQAEAHRDKLIDPEVDRILAGRKIDDEARANINRMVNAEIEQQLALVSDFEKKLEAHYRTGDAQKSVNYIKSQYDRIVPEAVKKVVAPLYRNIAAPAPRKPAAQAKPGAQPVRGEVTLKEMPEWKDIDFTKCTTADVASGWAILKSGKKASGWL